MYMYVFYLHTQRFSEPWAWFDPSSDLGFHFRTLKSPGCRAPRVFKCHLIHLIFIWLYLCGIHLIVVSLWYLCGIFVVSDSGFWMFFGVPNPTRSPIAMSLPLWDLSRTWNQHSSSDATGRRPSAGLCHSSNNTMPCRVQVPWLVEWPGPNQQD